MSIKATVAVKKYFDCPERPLENREIIAFYKADPKGFKEIAALCAKALGETIDES